MRMRFKPYARGELAAWEHYIDNPELQKEHWKELYPIPDLPFRIELGCGKGGFLASLALQEPNYNYLGVDIKSEMLVVAKRTIEKQFLNNNTSITNIKITSWNIEHILQIISLKDNINRIYINFCNPWYKSGHAKHRLTHPRQLIQYREFLQPEGEIHFKTDDDPLFEDSLRYFPMVGFEPTLITRDLHKEEPTSNIRTEHEQMFANEGISINACVAVMREANLDKEAISRLKTV